MSQFVVKKVLGKGSFGTVSLAQRKSDGNEYAIKRVSIRQMAKKEVEDTLNEIRFLSSVKHKNIVGFLEAFLDNGDKDLCIVMEYCAAGDLEQKARAVMGSKGLEGSGRRVKGGRLLEFMACGLWVMCLCVCLCLGEIVDRDGVM